MKTKKILLAGASGYLGSHITEELKRQSYPTRIVVRNKKKVQLDISNFEIAEAEVTKPETLAGVLEGIDVVISTIGITKQKDGLTYMNVDYHGNLNLLNEAKKFGTKKFIYVSALNAEKLTNLKMCHAKEKFVEELKDSGLDYCIIRPNGFFSDMSEFLKMAKKGKIELFGKGEFKMNPIHGADLEDVCVQVIESETKEFKVGGPDLFTHKEIADMAFKVIGKETKVVYMPEWLRKTILWSARTFSSSKKYGPLEFFFTVLSMDMIAPKYGTHKLSTYFEQQVNN